MTVQFAPQIKARIAAAAQQSGIDTATVLERLVNEYLPPVELNGNSLANGHNTTSNTGIDEENAAAIAFGESIIAGAPTDPEEMRQADADFREFIRNIYAERTIEGEIPFLK